MLRSFEALSTNSVRKCMEITLENLKLDTKRDLKGYERCLVHPVNHLQCCCCIPANSHALGVSFTPAG